MLFLHFVAAALAFVFAGFGFAQGLTPCDTHCVSSVFGNVAGFPCTAGDTLCFCGQNTTLDNGIHDCITQGCPGENPSIQVPLAEASASSFCSSAFASASAASSKPVSTTESVAPTSTSISSTPASTSTSASTSISSSTSASATVASTSSTPAATNQATSSSVPGASSSKTGTSSTMAPTTTTSNAPATSTTAAATVSAGFSTAVKAGIGAGVGSAVVLTAIVAFCVWLRRRQRVKKSPRAYQISEPMAGSGRQYANSIGKFEAVGSPSAQSYATKTTTVRSNAPSVPQHPRSPTSVYSYSSELDAHARRYEDMIPRTQPRTMI
ncbi:hypothetical protein F5Y16DRAFT_240191 [Xylariaceae sp. FL0255]|nr:hypothetical protein F5Y16DRAFT_240191 [Xylariaceae sp. FL0255]